MNMMPTQPVAPPLAAPAILSVAVAPPVVIAAGGTGGHFFPAEALAAALIGRGVPIALFTDARSGGQNSAVFAGHPVHVLRGAGIAGRGAAKAARAAAALAIGTLQARRLLGRMQASAIVGFGGYPCVAPILGSRLLRRRPCILLHEQNAVLGRANRALCKNADVLALSFADTSRIPPGVATVVTGNPIRPAIAALAGLAYAPPADERLRILILGGSLGAHVLSEVVPAALATLPDDIRRRLVITQQCRVEDIASVRATYLAAGIEAMLDSFFTDVARLLTEAHLVIARAGASTVAELASAGRPAILVPLPGAIDDHQAANATALGSAAWMIRQPDFSPVALAQLTRRLLESPAALQAAAGRIAAHAVPDAAERLADLVQHAIAQRGSAK